MVLVADLGGDEEVVSLHCSVLDLVSHRLSHHALGLVEQRCVDVTITDVDC